MTAAFSAMPTRRLNDVQSLLDHDQPGRHDRAVSRGQPICGQSGADAGGAIVRNGAEGRELATARWGLPSSSKALMDATKKRTAKLQAKGKPVDFNESLRMEPDAAAARPPAVTACDGSRTGCRRVRFRVVAPQSSLESHAPSRHIDGTMVHGRAFGRQRGDKLQCRASRARSLLRLLHLGL
jgi:hypothetical protein